MLTPKDILRDGETLVGNFHVEIVRWTGHEWASTPPPLYVILTDHRIVLQPQIRKRHEPAIIPARYITHVEELRTDRRRGIILRLKTGHRIGMFIAGDNRFVLRAVHKMMAPSSPVKFESDLELSSIRKMIEYLGSLE